MRSSPHFSGSVHTKPNNPNLFYTSLTDVSSSDCRCNRKSIRFLNACLEKTADTTYKVHNDASENDQYLTFKLQYPTQV